MKSNIDGVYETSHVRVKIPISSTFDHVFHLPKKWVKCTEKNADFGNHFQTASNLLAKLVHTIFFHICSPQDPWRVHVWL